MGTYDDNDLSAKQNELFVGASLKKVRESKKLSIEDVAKGLYVVPSIIIALEEETFDNIGPDVYIKGHLKNYATFLGLPAEEMLRVLSRSEHMKEQKVVVPGIADHLIALKIISYASAFILFITVIGIYISHH
jgi:cytoskeletal protein RodZ